MNHTCRSSLALAMLLTLCCACGSGGPETPPKKGNNVSLNNTNNSTSNNSSTLPDGLIAPGDVNGSWLLERDEDRALLFYLDLLHDEDKELVEGDFLLARDFNEYYEGDAGELAEASYTESTLVVRFNPTPRDPDRLLSLQLQASSINRFTGTMKPDMDSEEEIAVTLNRRNPR